MGCDDEPVARDDDIIDLYFPIGIGGVHLLFIGIILDLEHCAGMMKHSTDADGVANTAMAVTRRIPPFHDAT